jgi:hypothetical protein
MTDSRQILRVSLALAAALALRGPTLARAQSTDIHSYALFAIEDMRCKGLIVLDAGNIGVNDLGGSMHIHGRLGAPSSQISADSVRTLSATDCADLFSNDANPPICNAQHSFHSPFVNHDDIRVACEYPSPFPLCGGPKVMVGRGETRVITPGNYGDVIVKGSPGAGNLIFDGVGDYNFCSLTAGRNADLLFRSTVPGRVNVNVAGDIGDEDMDPDLGNGSFTGPEPGSALSSADIHFFAGGGMVHFSRRSQVHANLCAPNATVFLTQGTQLEGNFVADKFSTEHVFVRLGPPPTSTTTTSTSSSTTTSTTGTSSTSTSSSSTTTGTTSTSTTGTTPSTTSTTAASTTSTTAATTTTTTSASTTTVTDPSTTTTTSASTTTVTEPSTTTTTAASSTTVTEPSTTTTTAASTTTVSEPSTTTTTTAASTTTVTEPSSTTTTATSTTAPSTTATTSTSTTNEGSTTTTTPVSCGNGVLEDDEECDGTDFDGATCPPGSPIGALLCTGDCTIDRSQCKSPTTTTVTTSSTTTTTLPSLRVKEICGNCIDDDGDGLTDFEDPECCQQAQLFEMLKVHGKMKPHGSRTSFQMQSTLALSGLGGQVNPHQKGQDVFVQIRPVNGKQDIFCAFVPAKKFMTMHNSYMFWDRHFRVKSAKGLSDMTLIVGRNGRLKFRTHGPRVQLQTPGQSQLQVTIGFHNPAASDSSNRCSSTTVPFRTSLTGGLRTP